MIFQPACELSVPGKGNGLGGTSMREVGQKIQIPSQLTATDAAALAGSDTLQLLSQVRLEESGERNSREAKISSYFVANDLLMKQISKSLSQNS